MKTVWAHSKYYVSIMAKYQNSQLVPNDSQIPIQPTFLPVSLIYPPIQSLFISDLYLL